MASKPDAAQSISTQEKLDLLPDALVALPARCRDVVLLHKIKGISDDSVLTVPTGVRRGSNQISDVWTLNYAAFAELNWKATQNLSFTGGLRRC